MEVREKDGNARRSEEEEQKRRDEKKLFCQNPLSSHSVSQKGPAQCGALFSLTSRSATFSPFDSFFSPPFSLSLSLPSLPSRPLSSRKSGLTAIYFTSAPLYDCSRFAFMPDALPKRLSDKAMNTLSGSSLLVSLCLAGQ